MTPEPRCAADRPPAPGCRGDPVASSKRAQAVLLVVALLGPACSRVGFDASSGDAPRATGDARDATGSPAGDDADSATGDTTPAPIASFGPAGAVTTDGSIQITVVSVARIANLSLAVADGQAPVLSAACDIYFTRLYQVPAAGAPFELTGSGFYSGAHNAVAMNSAGEILLTFEDAGVRGRWADAAAATIGAEAVIGDSALSQPSAFATPTGFAVAAVDAASASLRFARAQNDGTDGFVLMRLGSSNVIAADEWADAITGFAALGGTPGVPAIRHSAAGDRLFAVSAAGDNLFGKVLSPLGGWDESCGSFSGCGISGLVDPNLETTKPSLTFDPDGRAVVAAAVVIGGQPLTPAGLLVVVEGATSFEPPDGTPDAVLTSVRPGKGMPEDLGDWDVGVCATRDAILVGFLDADDSHNPRVIRHTAALGWELDFFDADRDTPFDKTAGDETALAMNADGSTCYLAWEQSDAVFLVGFPVMVGSPAGP